MANPGIDYSWVTPELAKNPSVAASVATSADPGTNSVLASQSLNGVIGQDVVAEHAATHDSASFWTKAGLDVFKGLNFLAKPLQEVQRDYKFIHSVWKNGGVLPGFLAIAGTTLGGVAGSLLGPEGAVLGADIAGTLTRKLMGNVYKQSYADSENANYQVSAGRDFSNALSKVAGALGADGVAASLKNTDPSKGWNLGRLVSGLTDASFDVTTDPVSVLGKFSQLMKTGKYLKIADGAVETQAKYPIMDTIPGVKNFLDAHSGRVFTPQQLDAVKDGTALNATSRTYNAALDDMVEINKTADTAAQAAGTIAQKYPELGTVAPARIAALKDADEIHSFLRDSVYFGELQGTLAGSAILPSRTLLRAKGLEPIQKALRGDTLSNQEMNWVNKGYKTFSGYMPFSVDPVNKEISTKSFKWDSPDAASVIYRIARFGGGHSFGTEMAGQYAQAVAEGDVGLARAIKAQTTFDAFKAMGLPDESVLVQNAKSELEKLDHPTIGQQVYNSDPLGNPIGQYETIGGRTAVAGTSEHQFTDEFSIPDFNAAQRELRNAGKLSKYYGKLDTFTSKAYTNSIFKPLALATLGFGTRVAAAELIPAVARYGFVNMFKAKLASSAAKANYKLLEGEGAHVASAAAVALGAAKGISPDFVNAGFPAFKSVVAKGLAKVAPEDQLHYAIDLQLANDGHILNEGVSTGGGASASMRYDLANAAHSFFQQESKKFQYRELGDFTTYQADSPHYLPSYATSLTKEAKIAKGKNIASDIVDVFGGKTNKLPKGFTFQTQTSKEGIKEVTPAFGKPGEPFSVPEKTKIRNIHQVTVHDENGKEIANLNWRISDGEITHIGVDPEYQRKGIATNMFEKAIQVAKENGLKTPIHSDDLTPEGAAWKKFLENKSANNKIFKVTLEKELGNAGFEQYQSMRQELINREYQRIMDTKAGNYKPYEREASLGQRWKDQDPMQFATDRVDSVLGLTIGKDGTYHQAIAKNLASGSAPDLQALKEIDVRKLPATIPGNQIETYIPAGKTIQSAINHFVDLGFNKLIDPVINGLSREPLYLVHFSNEMESLKYLVNKGDLEYNQAVRIAQYRATHAMLPQIHNTALRTQFSQLAQNFMPFYFAQEQSVKRAYRAAKDTGMSGPLLSRSVRQYQMVEQVMNNPAFVQTDANGNSYAYLPLVGTFGQYIQKAANALPFIGNRMVSGLPISAQGSMTSLKSVVPGLDLPGLGPIAAIPANAFTDIFPALASHVGISRDLTTKATGVIQAGLGQSAGRGVWESILPSKPIMNLWNAWGPDQQNAAMTNAVMGALASAYYHQDELGNQVPTASSSTQEKEAFIDRIRNNARSILIIKAATGMLSPLSPRVEQTDLGLRDEFLKLVKSTGDYNKALLAFLQSHGDKAISYTVAQTTPSVRGANFPYTQKAINWIDDNIAPGGLLSDPNKSTGAVYLIPQDPGPGNTLDIHHQLIRDHLRQQRTPEEFFNQFFIAQGNNYIAPYLAQHTANVNAYKQMQNSYMLQQENQNWSDFMGKMKDTMPTWYENYTSGAGRDNAALAVSQLQNIFADPKTAPQTEQAKLVQGLLADYQGHMNIINQYKQLGITGQVVQMENQNWQTYLENLKTSDARLTSVINSVFSKVG